MKKIILIILSLFIFGCSGQKERVTFSKQEINEITSNYEKIIKEKKNYILKDENWRDLILNEIVGNINNYDVLYYEIIQTDNIKKKMVKLHNYMYEVFKNKKYDETWSFKLLPAFEDDINVGTGYMEFIKNGEEIQCGSYFFQFRKIVYNNHPEYIVMLITKVKP